jgi:CRP-like cAMP-binding protein
VQRAEPVNLTNIELLSNLQPAELRALEQRCSWRHYRRNEQILARESENRDVFFVVRGTVQIANFSAAGREIMLATVAEGGFFGELSAIDDLPRSATVTASDKCVIAALSPSAFDELVTGNSDIARQVFKRLARIIRASNERIMDLNTLGAAPRIYVELLRLAEPDPAVAELWSIYPMPTQADIAARAGTTRETVARVLGQLISDEMIKRKGKTLYLEDREALEDLVERRRQDQPYEGPERRKGRRSEDWYKKIAPAPESESAI